MSKPDSTTYVERYWSFMRITMGLLAEIGASLIMALGVGAGASMLLATFFSVMAPHKIFVTLIVALVFAGLVIRRMLRKCDCRLSEVDWMKAPTSILASASFSVIWLSGIVSALFLIGVLSISLAISFGAVLDLSGQAMDYIRWTAFVLFSGYCVRFVHWLGD